MKWIKDVVETTENITTYNDEEFEEKFESINNDLNESMYQHIEDERISEQCTLQLSKEYTLG